MKKMICILIVISVIFASVFSVSASHNIGADLPIKTECLYRDRAIEYVGYIKDFIDYREFCYYSDENNEEADWVLMLCQVDVEPWISYFGALVGNRAVFQPNGPSLGPYTTGLVVYIPETDTFIDLDNDHMDEIVELCPDFVETIENNKIGALMGDFYEDDEINILDATSIQRELAGLHIGNGSSYGFMTVSSGSTYFWIADFDRDGEVTVMDATAIQRYLVQG